MKNIRDVFREDPLKNRPQSTSPQRTEQGIVNRSTLKESQEIKGRIRLSKSGSTIVVLIAGEFIGWIGKWQVLDVVNRKRDIAYIYKKKKEEKKEEKEEKTDEKKETSSYPKLCPSCGVQKGKHSSREKEVCSILGYSDDNGGIDKNEKQRI